MKTQAETEQLIAAAVRPRLPKLMTAAFTRFKTPIEQQQEVIIATNEYLSAIDGYRVIENDIHCALKRFWNRMDIDINGIIHLLNNEAQIEKRQQSPNYFTSEIIVDLKLLDLNADLLFELYEIANVDNGKNLKNEDFHLSEEIKGAINNLCLQPLWIGAIVININNLRQIYKNVLAVISIKTQNDCRFASLVTEKLHLKLNVVDVFNAEIFESVDNACCGLFESFLANLTKLKILPLCKHYIRFINKLDQDYLSVMNKSLLTRLALTPELMSVEELGVLCNSLVAAINATPIGSLHRLFILEMIVNLEHAAKKNKCAQITDNIDILLKSLHLLLSLDFSLEQNIVTFKQELTKLYKAIKEMYSNSLSSPIRKHLKHVADTMKIMLHNPVTFKTGPLQSLARKISAIISMAELEKTILNLNQLNLNWLKPFIFGLINIQLAKEFDCPAYDCRDIFKLLPNPNVSADTYISRLMICEHEILRHLLIVKPEERAIASQSVEESKRIASTILPRPNI